ncbi:hypothetical protein N0P75_12380 [Citrobacter youngae]|uniref:hypothetical protein n=1 Tax=Citrobacter TaxID=544 RepID=UPI001290373E|nr:MULTISPECIES: hypothetical protein [Citrobacter]MBA8107964.1 hypothetical protein [Citrobacter sp. RHBSTW-00029]NHM12546.1 hypothetical protein [Citrobacter youngae]
MEACDVTLLLCATKVTRRVVQRFDDRVLVQFYGHAAASALRRCRPLPVCVKGTGAVCQTMLRSNDKLWQVKRGLNRS